MELEIALQNISCLGPVLYRLVREIQAPMRDNLQGVDKSQYTI